MNPISVKDRFLRYVALDTGSCGESQTVPTTERQWALAKLLVSDMLEMGIADARVDESCYVYGSIPANVQGQPAIGLIAHMDTSPSVPTGPVKARSLLYQGGDIQLESGAVIRAADFPALARQVGQELIVTDGRTLLGGDDKAGVAEILTACQTLLQNPAIPHGKICIGFTPDEEVGSGADHFDVPGFGADFAYTVDGGAPGEIEYENFNAASAVVDVRGMNIHPGTAKNKMRNAATLAMRFHALLPGWETPEHTEGYEGFFHLDHMEGCVEHAQLRYIVRDHDRARFEEKKERLRRIAGFLNQQCGEETFTLTITDSYYNMREKLETHMDVVVRAQNAMRALGVTPVSTPIRGGTDGARLSYMGLPCPNLPTGSYNHHGVLEYACVPEMQHMSELLVRLVTKE